MKIYRTFVKAVSNESIGYLIGYDVNRFGPSISFGRLVDRLDHFHNEETKTAIYDHCKTAYNKEHYTQVPNFFSKLFIHWKKSAQSFEKC